MLKRGILFYGLPAGEGEGREDITYLFLYGLCKNILCRAKIRDMKKEWREYLLKKADQSGYDSQGFWGLLEREERGCARVVLGLLEDFRKAADARAEKAWICLKYLIHSGYRKEETYLKGKEEISFRNLWEMEDFSEKDGLLRAGRICMCLIIAEENQQMVAVDWTFPLFEALVKQAENLCQDKALKQQSLLFLLLIALIRVPQGLAGFWKKEIKALT